MLAAEAWADGALLKGIEDGVSASQPSTDRLPDVLSELTYGGRKNCSSTTYMPLQISVKRKYLLALSMVLSCSSSHLAGRLTRSCVGDTPAGVADRGTEVENSAAVTGRACRDWSREACRMAEDAGRKRASAISGRVVAIVVGWWSGEDAALTEEGLWQLVTEVQCFRFVCAPIGSILMGASQRA